MVVVLAVFSLLQAVGDVGYAIHPALGILVVLSAIGGFGSALNFVAVKVLYANAVPANVRVQGLVMTSLAELPALLFGYTLAYNIFNYYGYGPLFVWFAAVHVVAAPIMVSAGPFLDVDRRNAALASLAGEEWRRAQAAGQGKMLVCRNVDVGYEGVQVLFGVDFDVEEGELIALLGTNGAGKSTLLRAISGSQQASGGAIVFNGRDVTHMPPHEIAARGVVHMPGGRGVFPGLSVRDNLTMGSWLSPDAAATRADLAEVYEIFPILRARLDDHAALLSGGEQQMLSLAQAFLMKPKLLMIDELSLGLSPAMVGQLLEVVRRIHDSGVTIIVVEQSVNVALAIATRAVFMEKGEVKFTGPTADLLARPDLLRAIYVKGTGALTDGQRGSARRTQELETARPVIQVDNIVKRFGGIAALDDVSMRLRDGEILGLIGPNGSGKTTLLDVISGFVVPDGGTVTYEGVDITRLSPDERARRKLVRRFQDAKLFPSLTVRETLLVSLEQRAEVRSTILAAASAPQARRSERRLRVRAERLIDLLDLGAYGDKFVKELSTGLRRIVDLACVLASEPHALLLDEPSSGIAQAEAEGLAPLLRRVKFETGCSILIIEHDMPLISAVADELIALDQGAIVIQGPPEVVLNDDRVIESYLGGTEAAIRRSGR
jgi:branched-chain amino acid transport system ATP-binding protein